MKIKKLTLEDRMGNGIYVRLLLMLKENEEFPNNEYSEQKQTSRQMVRFMLEKPAAGSSI